MGNVQLMRQYSHAELLPDLVNSIMDETSHTLSELGGIAVSIGPGSFTGLRIGLGLAKGLVFGLEIPLIAVPTMDALMIQIPGFWKTACVLLKARKGQFYRGIYQWHQTEWKNDDCDLMSEDEIVKNLPEKDLVFIGESIHDYEDVVNAGRPKGMLWRSQAPLPNGFSVAKVGMKMLELGHTINASDAVPMYFQRFQGIK
jgi:tRNA threonylcarbamoyladenosine biosynthesis protein TsaB